MGEANGGPFDLAVTGLATDVGGDLVEVGDASSAKGVPLAEQTTAQVDGGASSCPDRAVGEQARTLAGGT